jgi:hypothetical protein
MTTPRAPGETYHDQIARLARGLTAAGLGPSGDLPADVCRQMRLFAEENVEKRLEKLGRQVEFVAGAFEDLDDLLGAFCRALPQAAYADVGDDGDRFFEWLTTTRELTPEQRDHLACQAARHAVAAAARANRAGHLRFQELWSVAGRLGGELKRNRQLVIHLNPIRAWARFQTRALLDEEAEVPADVLFFAAGGGISTALLGAEGRQWVEELAGYAPCTLDQWVARGALAPRRHLLHFCRELAGMGLVAFA